MTPKQIKNFCLKNKQKGLIELTQKFDNINLETFVFNVPKNLQIDLFLAESIKLAKENIEKFHKAEDKKLQDFENDKIETSQGITCWKKFTPIENVGVYVPKKLLSSALMNIIPAKILGCKNIVVCTPPHPSNELLWTLNLLGIEKIYCIGGAQAIFALCYGIGEIPKVEKIFGPGNEFVDEAKRLIANEIAIDMPAGPSEVLIIADEFANKNAVLFDILAQLEHGTKSKAWLFAVDDKIAEYVKENINKIAFDSINSCVLKHSLQNLTIEKVATIEEGIEKSNKIAPEHLILNVKMPEKYLSKISNAGSVFVGNNTPESLGDYLSGSNHVLPTNGFAKSYSGLSVLSFGKFITFQIATKNGLKNVAENVKAMALAEGLAFHAKSVDRNL